MWTVEFTMFYLHLIKPWLTLLSLGWRVLTASFSATARCVSCILITSLGIRWMYGPSGTSSFCDTPRSVPKLRELLRWSIRTCVKSESTVPAIYRPTRNMLFNHPKITQELSLNVMSTHKIPIIKNLHLRHKLSI